ncbi:ADP-ribosylation factor 2-B [Phytophthora nicotianae]|uniref:ADP-ribosylation factor 2-B n=1 Tax=Phytophthora nicotianae TaxID=4792 RepID=A0A0W8DI41_PHYNI|nr:ADP-ribosylation factor 2-B [Phytophthora nicotianae]
MPAKTSRSVPKPRRKPASALSRAPKKAKKAKPPKKKVHTDPFTSKQVSSFYFKAVLDDDGEPTAVYVCRCGVQRRMEPNTGYTNLLGHVFMWHTNFVAEMTSASTSTGTLDEFIDDKTHKVLDRHGALVQLALLFLLVKYKRLLVREVETVIAGILPKSFGIIFDGWTFRPEHCVAVFASFRHDGKMQTIVIAIAPIIDDEISDHTASSNVKILDVILSYYGRSKASIAYIVGDNCSVNGAAADQLQVPMVGCASHRLNLAVNLLLAGDDKLLDKIQKLMYKVKNLLLVSAKSRRKTLLRPVPRQDTRWSSTFAIVNRYFELKEFLSDDDEDELTGFLPTHREEKQLKSILANPMMFESISKRLQSADAVTLLDVRDLFDALIAQTPEVAHYLAADAAIVKSPVFERACVSVLLGRKGALSDDDKAMLEPLAAGAAPLSSSSETTSLDEGFATVTLERARRLRQATSRFNDQIAVIVPTSNVVERFFSQAKAVVGMHCQAMTPLHVESILFLKVNRSYWSAATVRKVIRGTQ